MSIDVWIGVVVAVISLIITVGGFVVAVKSLKSDNRKSNEELLERTLKSKLDEAAEKAALEKRVSLLENDVNKNDLTMRRAIDEIKTMIGEVFERINKHFEQHHSERKN